MAWQALKDVWAPPNAPCSQLWGLGLDKDIRTSQFNSQLRTDLVAEHRVVIRIAGEEKQRRGLPAYGSVQREAARDRQHDVRKKHRKEEPTHSVPEHGARPLGGEDGEKQERGSPEGLK